MKTSERFTNAVTKLYNAFHENRLNGFDCKACAVGNICNNDERWGEILDYNNSNACVPSLKEDHFNKLKHNDTTIATGYSLFELSKIEEIFIDNIDIPQTKENQFKGLCAVVEYLCELEGIPNVMDYTSLFETENDKPKHQLQEVF